MNVAMRAFFSLHAQGVGSGGGGGGDSFESSVRGEKVRKYILFHTIPYYNYTIEFDIKSGRCSCPDGKV